MPLSSRDRRHDGELKRGSRPLLFLALLFLALLLAMAVGACSSAQTQPGKTSRSAPPRDETFSIALTGDSIITRRLSSDREPAFLELVEILRAADAAFTNLETVFHNFEGYAMPSRPSLRSDPSLAKELAWVGFDLLSRANNHAGDYGAQGMLETTKAVRKAELVQAGVGPDLERARQAAFFRTARGSVGLISATSTFAEYSRAGRPRGKIPGRPGISPLRFTTSYVVRREQLEALRVMARELGASPPPQGDRLEIGANVFVLGERTGIHTAPNEEDLTEISAVVQSARRKADHLIVSIHAHEADRDRSVPAEFLVTFARAMIDAGADIVVGHGPHVLRGIEIYKGKPIFYSLANFLFEFETVEELPSDDYESVGLGKDARVADFFDRYDDAGRQGYPADPEVWESVVAVTRWRGKDLIELDLHPITLGFGLPRRERGRPMLAPPELCQKIVERLARLCEPFDTRIEFRDGIGRILLPAQNDRPSASYPYSAGGVTAGLVRGFGPGRRPSERASAMPQRATDSQRR